MTEPIRILFVDDEPAYRRGFRTGLREDKRLVVETAASGEEALDLLGRFRPGIVFTDLRMPLMDGLTLLREIKKRAPETFVLVLTGVDSAREAVEAIKSGAYEYLVKPLDMAAARKTIEKIIAHQAFIEGRQASIDIRQTVQFENLVGRDPKMFEVYEKIHQVAKTNSTVRISGESGTGKELIAAAIHANSSRKNGPFIQVNCAALSEGLINSELFGYEKGAFTGAVARKKGFFEAASGGTIFLDEIGDIPLVTQVALLRVLELGTFQRVGGTETVTVDVRLICATHRDLGNAIRERLFREDLYYRINVVSIHVPALRERKSDIPLLANYFRERSCAKAGKTIQRIAPEMMDLLCRYDWPGNVRELANVIERSVIFARGVELTPDTLPDEIRQPKTPSAPLTLNLPTTSLAAAEALLIRQVLEQKGWNLKQAAEALDIARGTLYGKMEKYGIFKPD